MTAGLELLAAREWLYAKLAGDATLTGIVGARIYAEQAPENATFPLLMVVEQSPGNDLRVVGTGRIWSDPLFQVKAVDQTASYAGNLATLAARIDAVLHGSSGSATNGKVWACARERPFSMAETGPGGEQYRHLGGLYRVMAA
jgi:hypothetical protein